MSEITLPTGEFVSLPTPPARGVAILGPNPQDAATAVFPFQSVGAPIGPLHALIAGVCGRGDDLVEPLELWTIVDPQRLINPKIPAEAVWRTFRDFHAKVEAPASSHDRLLPLGRLAGLVLYCRRRHLTLTACGVDGSDLLAAGETLVFEAAGRQYSPNVAARSPDGVYPLEQLLIDQGQFARNYAELFAADPVRKRASEHDHLCCTCPEQPRCYPADGGYAFALDRLFPLSLVPDGVHITPHGAWTLAEAAAIAGGARPLDLIAESAAEPNAYHRWRRTLATEMEAAAPLRLLAGETDGRELVEAARVKLTLILGVLRQLHLAWQQTGRPHLCWSADSVRVRWQSPAALPASVWGLTPVLRFAGVQPAAAIEAFDRSPTHYPPHFSDLALLPPEISDAVRNFDVPRRATVFVKRSKAAGNAAEASLLLEALHLPWESFCPGDTLHIRGEGWTAVAQPAPLRDKNDGEGLPFVARVIGKLTGFKSGEQFDNCECRWYPRFEQAVDLHALGMLLFETLLATDENPPTAYRAALIRERDEMIALSAGVPSEQRDTAVREFIAQRALVDAASGAWTRRNLLFRAADRERTTPDGFSAEVWLAIVTFGMRLITNIEGFSFCADRASTAPLLANGPLLPLVELEGLVALLDDELFSRTAPGRDAGTWLSELSRKTPIAESEDE